jgi:undecaprenyl-diphosphatase
MDFVIAFILGLVQGVTEFLPISSSGHLVILQSLFNIVEGGLLLDTILHLGTAFSIIFVFRKDILALVGDSIGKDTVKRSSALSYIGYLIVATIPAAVLGVLFNDYFEALFTNPKAAGSMLLVTAALLFISAIRKSDGGPVTLLKAIVIGLAQAIAIMPGLSRSGSTIAIALLVGVARDKAGKFSFLLALPAIFGAALLHARKIDTLDMHILPVLLGFIVSFIVGIAALKLLIRFVQKGKLYYFGFYCALAGILCVLFFK